jgi:hypothetical protein
MLIILALVKDSSTLNRYINLVVVNPRAIYTIIKAVFCSGNQLSNHTHNACHIWLVFTSSDKSYKFSLVITASV